MKKRLSVFLLAMVMILSVCPVACVSAADATGSVIIYDAYIDGNFVDGKVLTAKYSFYTDDSVDFSEEETNKTIDWYALSRYGTYGTNHITLQENSATYTASDAAVDGQHAVYFKVTPTSSTGEPIADAITVYSHLGATVVAADSTKTTPEAVNAGIVPHNPQGTMRVGDKVSVRFSYKNLSGSDLAKVKVTWYTSEEIVTDYANDASKLTEVANTEKVVDGGVTENGVVPADWSDYSYTIQPADAGKWIYAKIIPVSADNIEGTALYTRNHLGNAFYGLNASATTSNFYNVDGARDVSALLANSLWNYNYGATRLQSAPIITSSETTLAYVTVDAGETVPFDGFCLQNGARDTTKTWAYGNAIPNVVISISNDGTTWQEVVNELDVKNAEHPHIYSLGKTEYARYFKLSLKSVTTTTTETAEDGTVTEVETTTKVKKDTDIHYFYPFLRNDAVISCDESFATFDVTESTEDVNKIMLSAWGTPKSVIANAISSESGAEVNIKFVDGKDAEITEDFVVDENLTDTFVTFESEKVDAATGKAIPTKLEIKYRGDIATNAKGTETGASATVMIPTVEFKGNPNGKYMLSAKIYTPSTENVSLTYWTNDKWDMGAYARNFFNFYCDTSKIGIRGLTSNSIDSRYKYISDMWHDVEIFFDYSTYDSSGTGSGNMIVYIYVDGKLMYGQGYKQTWAQKDKFDPNTAKVSINNFENGKLSDAAKYMDVVLREVYEIKSLVTPPEYDLSLMSGETAAEEIGANTTYTMSDNIGVYHIDTVNYLATYDVTYDAEGTEIKRQLVALDGAVKANGEVATISTGDSISKENADGSLTKKEVRAFSFAPDMVAVAKAGVWKAK